MKHLFLSACCLLLIALVSNAQSNHIYTRQYRDSVLKTYIGTTYPDYHLSLPGGKQIKSADNKGKVVFINIWFGGCLACMDEFKALNELYDSLKGNDRFVFLSIASEPPARVIALCAKYDIHYPVAFTDYITCSKLNYTNGFPANIIIDKNGKIAVFKVEGYSEKLARQMMLEKFLPEMKRLADQ